MLSDLLNKGQKSFGTKSQNDRDLQNFLKEKEWLGEVSAIPLQQSLRDLEQSYSNFFGSSVCVLQ